MRLSFIIHLQQLTAKRGAGGVQARGHGPRLHAHRGRDRFVVEVGVVTEEENESLPLRERSDECRERTALEMSVGGRGVARRESRTRVPFGGLSSSRLVDHDPEEPAFERAAPAEAAPVPECPDEGVVHGLLAELLVTQDRDGNTQKHAVSIAIDALDLVRSHHLKTQSRAFSFRGEGPSWSDLLAGATGGKPIGDPDVEEWQ